MVLETAAFLVACGLVVGVGVPIASALAQARRFRGYATVDARSRPADLPAARAFEPLDLGPDRMLWPSQTPHATVLVPLPPWPSETWDDPQFGAQGRKSQAARDTSDAAREQAHQVARAAETARRVDAAPKKTEAAPRKADAGPKPAEPPKRTAGEARKVEIQRQAEAKRPPPSSAAPRSSPPQAEAEFFTTGGQPPSAAEIERMIQEVGLAATVQQIIARTGWDFQQAAKYLSKVRRNR